MTQTICDHCNQAITTTKDRHIARQIEIDNTNVCFSQDLCSQCVVKFKKMIKDFYHVVTAPETPVSSVAATTISENV